jgi:hypothetical protein
MWRRQAATELERTLPIVVLAESSDNTEPSLIECSWPVAKVCPHILVSARAGVWWYIGVGTVCWIHSASSSFLAYSDMFDSPLLRVYACPVVRLVPLENREEGKTGASSDHFSASVRSTDKHRAKGREERQAFSDSGACRRQEIEAVSSSASMAHVCLVSPAKGAGGSRSHTNQSIVR